MTVSTAGPEKPRVEDRLRQLIRQSPFRVFMVQLPDSLILEVSPAIELFAGRSRAELLSVRLLDIVSDPDAAAESFSLLAQGTIDGYARRGGYRRPDGTVIPVDVSFMAYTDQCPRTAAVATLLAIHPEELVTGPPTDQPGLIGPATDASELQVVLGTVDSDWRIDRITSDVAALLGPPPAELLGTSVSELVHPEDASSLLLLAAHVDQSPGGTTGRVRLRTADDGWVQCRVSVLPLGGGQGNGFAFALSPVRPEASPTADRVRELEEHLRRIAREVAASGLVEWSTGVPTSLEVPALSSLSSREYEIVVRLSGGQRVPAIARALFLSESTVRNHLTSVYRKFSVGSQQELLEVLRRAKAGAG